MIVIIPYLPIRGNNLLISECGLDLLSQKAFNDGVRAGIASHPERKFTDWIPIWICKEHGERAWTVLDERLAKLTPTKRYSPTVGLNNICKIMKQM